MKYYIQDSELFNDKEYAYCEHYLDKIKTADYCADYCPKCGQHISSLYLLDPLEAKVSKKKLGDCIHGTYYPFLVSEYFKECYENESLIGIDNFRPIDIYFRKIKMDVKYYYPHVVFNKTKIDFKKSKAIVSSPNTIICDLCGNGKGVYYDIVGIHFQEGSIIDEDIFRLPAFNSIFVNEKFVEFINKYKITNFKYHEMADFIPTWAKSYDKSGW